MRILVTCQPGYGHLHPLLPVARAARAAGHEVLVATAAAMSPVVEAAGFPCAPAGMDWLLAQERQAFPEMAQVEFGDEHFRLQLTRVFRDATARAMLPDLLRICRDWRPDAIVRDDQEHGALLAAELLGLPHAVAGVLWLYAPDLQALVSAALEELLAEHGLGDMPAMERAYRYLTLAALPPCWAAQGEVVPATTHWLRPEAFANDGVADVSMLAGLPAQPLVHANLGTIVGGHADLHATVLAACADLPVNLVLSIGPHQDPAAFGPQPANIRVIDHIPPGIMQHCDVALVHAGYGSTMAAIASGRPMVLLPVAADQPRNARRCVELGLGVALFEGERSVAQIKEAVCAVLGDGAMRARSRAMQAAVEALPDATHGVALLERLVASGEALPGSW